MTHWLRQYSVRASNTCCTLPVRMTVRSVTRTYSLPPGTWTSMSVSFGLRPLSTAAAAAARYWKNVLRQPDLSGTT